MNSDELKTWATDIFWPAYKTLCKTPYATKWTGGARGEAISKIMQLKPSEELRTRILSAIGAQREHRIKLYEQCGSAKKYEEHTKYIKLYTNRDGRTWLHNSGWDDEIPSLAEHKLLVEDEQKRELEICGCGAPAFNRSQCAKCYTKTVRPDFIHEVKEHLKKMGYRKLDHESWREASLRCLRERGLSPPNFDSPENE